jgi:hypothetical protein
MAMWRPLTLSRSSACANAAHVRSARRCLHEWPRTTLPAAPNPPSAPRPPPGVLRSCICIHACVRACMHAAGSHPY